MNYDIDKVAKDLRDRVQAWGCAAYRELFGIRSWIENVNKMDQVQNVPFVNQAPDMLWFMPRSWKHRMRAIVGSTHAAEGLVQASLSQALDQLVLEICISWVW